MATGVGHGRICLTSFNSPTPAGRNDLRNISYTSHQVIAYFVSNFVAMGVFFAYDGGGAKKP